MPITKFSAAALCVTMLCFASAAHSQTTVFQTDFEYTTEPSAADIGTDVSVLNFADSQIGTFSGTVPTGAGGQFAPNLIGFADNPTTGGGRLLWVDRPVADGSFQANFADPVEVDGANVSFQIGSRRTQGGNRNKDYDIIGRDQNSNELFRLTVNTQNGQERLGVTHSGGTLTSNLIADFGGVGSDANLDLDNIGGTPFDTNDIGTITLDLTDTGYTIDFTNEDDSNQYTTGEIPFNGTPDSLFSQIEFSFPGGGSNPVRSGFVLDNLAVQGNLAAVPEPASVAIWSLIGLGLAGFGYCRIRRRK